MHLDDCFPNEGGSKECPEGYEKMAACDASKIKERVGNLGKCAGDGTMEEQFMHTPPYIGTP